MTQIVHFLGKLKYASTQNTSMFIAARRKVEERQLPVASGKYEKKVCHIYKMEDQG